MLGTQHVESVSPWRIGVTARARDKYRNHAQCGRVLPDRMVQSIRKDHKHREKK
jgi:hypothetical protein